jgi:hypothetical protein
MITTSVEQVCARISLTCTGCQRAHAHANIPHTMPLNDTDLCLCAWMQASYACSKDIFLPELWQACERLKELLQKVAETLHANAASIDLSSRGSTVRLLVLQQQYCNNLHVQASSIHACRKWVWIQLCIHCIYTYIQKSVSVVYISVYYCNSSTATIVLQQYYCNSSTATIVLQQYYCNSITATVYLLNQPQHLYIYIYIYIYIYN